MEKKNSLFTKYFTILLVIGVIVNTVLFVKFYSGLWDWTFYVQVVGLILLGVFQYGMHVNKSKLAGYFGFIVDFLQLIIFIQLHIWGMAITYAFGVCSELYLGIKGSDDYQEHVSWKVHLFKLVFILIGALGLYWFFHDAKMNWYLLFFDLVSTVLIPAAYFLQARQSPHQFVFWVVSDITGIMPPILSGNLYSVLAFAYYIIFDSLNWIKWVKFSTYKTKK